MSETSLSGENKYKREFAMEQQTVELILSGVITFATVAYTIINLMQLVESKATRKQKLAPMIVAYLQSTASKNVLCLYIKNVGEGCARNVKVNVLQDYNCLGKIDWPLSRFPLFSDGVYIFPAGYHLHYYLDYWNAIRANGMEGSIELEISCEDINGKKQSKSTYYLKFNQIQSNYSTPPDTIQEQIPFYLKAIHEDLKVKNES